MKGQRIGMIAALILLVLLFAAWFDGGEEPLRPVEQVVAVPQTATGTTR